MKSVLKCVVILATFSASIHCLASTVKVTVNGMVCGFCAQGITKKFKATPGVEKVDVNLSDKQVTLSTRDGKNVEDSEIKKILADSGYNVVKIERN